MSNSEPKVTLFWLVEDAGTDSPLVTHHFHRDIGVRKRWPAVGDHVEPPVPIGRPTGLRSGLVTGVFWSGDLGEITIMLEMEIEDWPEETEEHLTEAGWTDAGISLSGEGSFEE